MKKRRFFMDIRGLNYVRLVSLLNLQDEPKRVVTVDDEKIFNSQRFPLISLQMHAMGIHSALAIKRQRKRRDDQKRAQNRRYSIQSTESGETHSPHGSTRRKHRKYGHNSNVDSKVRLRNSFAYQHIAIPVVRKCRLLLCHALLKIH